MGLPKTAMGGALALALIFGVGSSAYGQTLEERLREVGNAYSEAYIQPLVDGLGADMNSGLFQAARFGSREDGLGAYLGVRIMAMPLGGDDESFSLTYRGTSSVDLDFGPQRLRLQLPATYTVDEVPTVFGSTEPGTARVRVRQDTSITYLGIVLPVSIDTTFDVETIGGLTEDLGMVPFAVLQGGVGTFFGTSLMVRWLPPVSIEDFGSTGFFGIGIRHNLNRYLPVLPVQLAVQGAWQRAHVLNEDDDEVLRVTAFAANLEASRRFGAFTLFGGIQTEEGSVRIDYRRRDLGDDDEGIVPIDLDLRSANTMRFVLGGVVNAGPVSLYGDLNLGNRTIFSAGLGVTL